MGVSSSGYSSWGKNQSGVCIYGKRRCSWQPPAPSCARPPALGPLGVSQRGQEGENLVRSSVLPARMGVAGVGWISGQGGSRCLRGTQQNSRARLCCRTAPSSGKAGLEGPGKFQGQPFLRDLGSLAEPPCPCRAAEATPRFRGASGSCWTQHSRRMGSAGRSFPGQPECGALPGEGQAGDAPGWRKSLFPCVFRVGQRRSPAAAPSFSSSSHP